MDNGSEHSSARTTVLWSKPNKKPAEGNEKPLLYLSQESHDTQDQRK